MSRRLALALLTVALVGGCAPRGSDDISADDRADALRKAAHEPRSFVFRRSASGVEYQVAGEVEDDYRYRAKVSLGERDFYEEAVVDDQRFLRVIDASLLPSSAQGDAAMAQLAARAWVGDAAAAPVEFAKADAPKRLLDPSVVLDAVRYLERVHQDPDRLDQMRDGGRHDPESTSYLRRNDKFPRHEGDGTRYDVLPASYPGDFLFREGIPPDLATELESYFLYVSYWFDEGRVTRVEVFFDVDVKAVTRDIRAANERQAERTGVQLDALPSQPVPQPYRETYTFTYPSEPVRIAAPTVSGSVTLPPVGPATEGTQ